MRHPHPWIAAGEFPPGIIIHFRQLPGDDRLFPEPRSGLTQQNVERRSFLVPVVSAEPNMEAA